RRRRDVVLISHGPAFVQQIQRFRGKLRRYSQVLQVLLSISRRRTKFSPLRRPAAPAALLSRGRAIMFAAIPAAPDTDEASKMTQAAGRAAERDRFFEASLERADGDVMAAVTAEL